MPSAYRIPLTQLFILNTYVLVVVLCKGKVFDCTSFKSTDIHSERRANTVI